MNVLHQHPVLRITAVLHQRSLRFLETYKAMDIPQIAILLLDIYKQKDYIAIIISI